MDPHKYEKQKQVKWEKRRAAYQRYLRSPWWKARRARHLAENPCCTRCGATEDVAVHHRNYLRLGREKDEDLETLCDRCHYRRHHREGEKELAETPRWDLRERLRGDYWGGR